MPRGVLFDAGGTLVQVHADRLAAALRARDQEPRDLGAAFWQTMTLLEDECGPEAGVWEDWFPQWLARMAATCGVPHDVMAAAWRETDDAQHLWDDPIPGAAACLRRLRAHGVRVGVVSNSGGGATAALERAGLADLLEVIVDSSVVGVAKPDPAIFAHALEPLGLAPSETWYLGDTVAYDAAAADAAGLQSWIIDHPGLHTVPHPRRVRSLDEFADAVLAD